MCVFFLNFTFSTDVLFLHIDHCGVSRDSCGSDALTRSGGMCGEFGLLRVVLCLLSVLCLLVRVC